MDVAQLAYDMLSRALPKTPEQAHTFAIALGHTLDPSRAPGAAVGGGRLRYCAIDPYLVQRDDILFALAEWGLREAGLAANDASAQRIVDILLSAFESASAVGPALALLA